MRIEHKKSSLHKFIILFELVAVVGLGGAIAWLFLTNNDLIAKIHEPFEVAEVKLPEPTGAKTRFMFNGTVFWGRNSRNVSQASDLKEDYLFEHFDSYEREKYDAWIGNLECPITDKEHTKYEEDEIFAFNCLPSYLKNVSKYWTAFSLGTNHADNWGDEGIEITKQNLSDNNIQYFGNYHYDNATENCGIVVVPTTVSYDDGSTYQYNMPFGFCSAHGVFGIPTEDALQNIKTFAETVPTIVMPHMGVEYENTADTLRTNLYHKMIDYGADMVLADHPHHVQNIEVYDGHLIAYSMGNFMFDQLFDETVYGAGIDITANFDSSVDFELWDEISNVCLEKHGDCLDEIIESKLPRFNVTWSDYDFIASTNADTRQPRVGNENDRAFVEKRLNWYSTIKNL